MTPTECERRALFINIDSGMKAIEEAQIRSKANVSNTKALFSSKKFCKIDTVALSFVFDKKYPIID